MSRNLQVKFSSRITHHIPLRLILVVPFLIQIFAAVSLVGYLSFKNGQKAVNDLAGQLIDKTSQQVDEHLDAYLALPQKLNQINADAIASGRLNVDDPSVSEQYFWSQARAFPNLSYIGFALPDGRESGAGRWIKGVDLLLYENLAGAGIASDYIADEQGHRAGLAQSYQNDPLENPWNRQVLETGKPAWSRISTFEASTIPGIGVQQESPAPNATETSTTYVAVPARYPLYDQNGKFISLLMVDLLLTDVSKFLSSLQISSSGQVFIIERDGLMVGSSSPQPILHKVDGETKRYSALDSPDPMIHTIAQAIQQHFTDLQAIQTPQELVVNFDGERQFIQITPWRDQLGLDWLMVVAVPETDFMAQINANTHTTILLCFGALMVAAILGIYTSKWITRPILRLKQVSEAIASGNLDQAVAPTRIDELDTVARSFNYMAQRLQDSFNELEKTNNELEQRVDIRTAELSQALVELKRTQTQLIQTEKMSSLGQLVAGVAHEINNPVNFIHGNLAHTEEYTHNLLNLVELYQTQYPHPAPIIRDTVEEIDLDFLKQDFPKLLGSMQVGAERIREIVKSLRNFSRLDEAEFKAVDVHEGLDSTLLILQNRLKQTPSHPGIHLIKNYGELPLVECYPGLLNQVFMNLLSNAIDALNEYNKTRTAEEIATRPSTITISTELNFERTVVIRIADNGKGISQEIADKLFDPFFTTKPIGQGTGLGLSISYQIVVEQHNGKLYHYSAPSTGTEFVIEIPVHQTLKLREQVLA